MELWTDYTGGEKLHRPHTEHIATRPLGRCKARDSRAAKADSIREGHREYK